MRTNFILLKRKNKSSLRECAENIHKFIDDRTKSFMQQVELLTISIGEKLAIFKCYFSLSSNIKIRHFPKKMTSRIQADDVKMSCAIYP